MGDHGEDDRTVSGQIETYLSGFDKEAPAWVQAFLSAIKGAATFVDEGADYGADDRRSNLANAITDSAEMIADATVLKLEARETARKEAHTAAIQAAVARALEVGCYKKSTGSLNGVESYSVWDVESADIRVVRLKERQQTGWQPGFKYEEPLRLGGYGYIEAPEYKRGG